MRGLKVDVDGDRLVMKGLSISEFKYGPLHWHLCGTNSIERTLVHVILRRIDKNLVVKSLYLPNTAW